MYGLVQWLADRCAEAEGRPARPVPRLDNDSVLPDQLRVMINDLLAVPVADDMLDQASDTVDAIARAL